VKRPKEKYAVGAIILAAGQSKRMEQNKMLLPFAGSTVIQTIVSEVAATSARDVVVVTGYESEKIAAVLQGYLARCVFNPDYAQSEMIVSIQVGLRTINDHLQAALIVLGDQPRIRHDMVHRIIAACEPGALIVPSYQRQRGHPILIDRALWSDILTLPPTSTLRDFIRSHEDRIRYIEVDSDSVLRDMDTPEDYQELIHEITRRNTKEE
jgi:molybdenum cofactor cytidylyltransferase